MNSWLSATGWRMILVLQTAPAIAFWNLFCKTGWHLPRTKLLLLKEDVTDMRNGISLFLAPHSTLNVLMRQVSTQGKD